LITADLITADPNGDFALHILLLTSHLEPSDPVRERWLQLSRHLQDHGLSMVPLEVQADRVQAARMLDAGALAQAQSLHAQQAFDLVISSGPPIAAHLTAQAFSKLAGLSWVADWPEPFALESHKVLGWFDRQLEAQLLRAADQVLVSSEALAIKYRMLRGERDDSLLVVRNGFDRSELRSESRSELSLELSRDSTRAKRERLRIICSQTTQFNPVPFLETLQARTNLRESLEVIFSDASTQIARLIQAFELEDCVHGLNASEPEAAALEVSADALLSFGLNSVYRSPIGLARVLARQRPILHVFENALDPSFEVLNGTRHLPSENNRFALTAALEAAIQADWIMPGSVPREVSSLLSPEQYCWDTIGRSLIGFVCLAGSDRAISDRPDSDRPDSNRTGVSRQTVAGLAAKI
jgi:hypothetical protein